jgi:hypothetical protein
MITRGRLSVALLAVLCLAASQLEAQVLYGSLVGNVVDQSDSAVPGAQVTVVNASTNLQRSVQADATGTYRVSALPPGTYTVRVGQAGFQDFVATEVPVTLNNVTRVNARLQLGQVQETVSVTADSAPLLQTERAEVRIRDDVEVAAEPARRAGPQLPVVVPHRSRPRSQPAPEQLGFESLAVLFLQRQRRQRLH